MAYGIGGMATLSSDPVSSSFSTSSQSIEDSAITAEQVEVHRIQGQHIRISQPIGEALEAQQVEGFVEALNKDLVDLQDTQVSVSSTVATQNSETSNILPSS